MSGDVRNVYVHDCDFEGTDRAVRIKSRRGRGGVVEHVWAENLRTKNLKYEVVIMNMDYSADRNTTANEKPPVFRHIHLRNLTGNGSPAAIRLQGLDDAPIEDVTFEDLTIASTAGVIAQHVKNLLFKNVQITPAKGPVFALSEARDITIQGTRAPTGTEVFLTLAGPGSRGIRLDQSDLTAAKKPFTLAPEVAADAVTVR